MGAKVAVRAKGLSQNLLYAEFLHNAHCNFLKYAYSDYIELGSLKVFKGLYRM